VTLDLVTASRLRAFRSCARLHHYKYDLCVTALSERGAARFGTLAHSALEQWFLSFLAGGGHGGRGGDPLGAALEAVHASAEGDEESDPFEVERAAALLQGYHHRWLAEPLEVLAVEAEFRAPLINPDTGARSRTYDLAGKIDVIVRDQKGRDWIVEHKTTTLDISAGSDYWKRLRLDAQVSIYFDGAKALGFDPVGCIYDVLFRPLQRPYHAACELKHNKDGSLRKGQRLADETSEEFGARLREAIAEDPSRYYQRGEVVRLEEELQDARWDVWHSARLIRETELAGRHVRNPGSCVQFGHTCEFWDACTGSASIDDEHRFVKRESAHPELAAMPQEEAPSASSSSSSTEAATE
jgi:hypothetical protein